MDNKKIGLFISELRKEQGFNQKELAQQLSVTDKAVSKWETGRGLPDISILQPLAGILGVTVGELLNGERIPEQEDKEQIDKKLIKKLKIKRYIRLVVELVLTAICFWYITIIIDTFKDYRNVLDCYLHKNEIYFISNVALITIALFTVWVLTVIITAVFKKKASVFKTIIVCITASFLIGSSIYMGILDSGHDVEIYEEPIDTISYIKYEDFFDDDYDTQIVIKDTNEKITEHYSANFEHFDPNSYEIKEVYTYCVTAGDYKIIKAYYDENKKLFTDSTDYEEINNDLCKKLGISEGYYLHNYSDKDIVVHFLKGNSCFKIEISNASINDESLQKAIIEL